VGLEVRFAVEEAYSFGFEADALFEALFAR
jgi:hypothetical protein